MNPKTKVQLMRGEIGFLILLGFVISLSVISNPKLVIGSNIPSIPAFLSVDKSSGYPDDTFTFNVTFLVFPNSSAPFRLEYQPLRSSSWQFFGEKAYISDFQRNGNSIYDAVVPSDLGILQEGNYNFRAVYGVSDQYTNLVSISFTSTVAEPPIQQQGSERLIDFYVLIAILIIVALLLVFLFISHLMKSPTETW